MIITRACACCDAGISLSRRGFIRLAAASAVLTSCPLRALATTAGDMIDVHHHMVPPFWFDEVRDVIAAQGGGRIVPNWLGWSPQRAVAEMDKNGVATAVLSMSTPGIWFGNVEQARRLARQCNDYAAQMAKDGDKWLGDPAYDRVFEELNRRQAVVYVHPATPACCTKLMPHVPPFLTEFIQETNRAITSLMYSGTLSKYRDIKFIFSHAGGAIPTLAGRIAQLGAAPQLASKVPEGIEAVLQRQYYEIANSANLPAMSALTGIIPVSQVLFGSDFPLVPLPATAGGLAGLKLSVADLQAIRRENALRLLPRLRL
jgi:hypothetical protein